MRKSFTIIELLVIVAILCIIITLILGAITGCANNYITEGRVCFRQFIPKHTETETHYIEIPSGDSHISIPITSSYVVPDEYIIKIEGIHNGKVRTRIIKVDCISYKMLKEGDWLNIQELPLKVKAEQDE